MRKIRYGVVSAVLLCTLAACSGQTQSTGSVSEISSEESKHVYEGTAKGFGGDITAKLTVTDGTITAIDVNADAETPEIGGKAVEPLVEAILVAQNTDVDSISGATITSDAIKSAVKNGMVEAGILTAVAENNEYKPGTYSTEVMGRNAKIVMNVTFSDQAITDIEISEHHETAAIADKAFERIIGDILEYQTIHVDAVTGATVTSNAIISGVKKTTEEAGGSVDALMISTAALAQPQEPIEKTADVIVVGGGGAGMSAALSAIDEGSSVILIEKTASLGGNTVLCGGAMNGADKEWAVGFDAQAGEVEALEQLLALDVNAFPKEYQNDFNTLKLQIEEYIASGAEKHFDSVELHTIQTYYNGLRTTLDGEEIYGNYDLVSMMTSNAMDAVEWLREKGVNWNDEVVTQPVGAMWRRGHNPAMPKGTEYVSVMEPLILQGGEIMFEVAANELIVENGKAVGVKAQRADGTEVTLYANKGVVLATGGYGNNLKMVQEYNNYWEIIPDDTGTTNAAGLTGDGIKMGLNAGAGLTGMEFAQMMPVSDPETGDLFTGLIPQTAANYIMFNTDGLRFINEAEARDTLTKAAFENGGTFFLVADSVIAEECRWLTNWEEEVERGNTLMADSLEELGAQMGYNEETTKTFVAEVEKYNAYVEAGHDPEYGKTTFNNKIDVGPFYATPRKPAIHHTMGGLVIDKDNHVLTADGNVIQGLYAAGEVTGGIHAGNRLGGNAVTDIMVFGYNAGKNAANGK